MILTAHPSQTCIWRSIEAFTCSVAITQKFAAQVSSCPQSWADKPHRLTIASLNLNLNLILILIFTPRHPDNFLKMSSRKRRSSPSLQDSSASQSTFPSPARTEKRKLHSPAQQQSISYSQLSKDTASCQVEATSDRQKQDSSVKSSLVPSSSGKKKRNSKASSLRTPTKTSDVAIMPATGKATPLTSSKEKRVDSVAAQDTPGNKVKKPETKASMVLDPSCPAAKSTPTVDPSIKSQKRSKQVTETESVSQPNNMPAVKPEQITLGIRTLIEHSNKTIRKKTDEGHMFADDVGSNEQFVSLVLSMKKIPNKEKHKPVKMCVTSNTII